MFQITAQFPTAQAAVNALLAIQQAGGSTATMAPAHAHLAAGVSGDEKAAVVAPPKSKPATKDEAAPAPAVAAPTQPTASAPVAAAPVASASAVEYPTLQKAVFQLAQISRDETSAVVKGFGVESFKQLDPSRWAEALAAVNEKIAELSVPA